MRMILFQDRSFVYVLVIFNFNQTINTKILQKNEFVKKNWQKIKEKAFKKIKTVFLHFYKFNVLHFTIE